MMWLNLPKALSYKKGTALPPENSWILSEWTQVAELEESFNFSSCRIHQNRVATDLSNTKDTVG